MFDGWRPGHLPLYWYQEQFPQQFATAWKFAFVRDPLERAYSAFAFLRGNELSGRDQAAQQLVRQYRDFDDFVLRWLHPENIPRQLHFAAQTDFLTDSLGHLALDFIGYQEHLHATFSWSASSWVWPVSCPTSTAPGNVSQCPHVNFAPRAPGDW